jgi:predicted dehydrogenase
MEDAEIMLESAERNGRKLMVSQSARYKSQPRTVRKLIEENIAGRISYVVIDFQKGPQFPGFRTEMEYPLLIDMAIHHFDLMRYITGQDSLKVYAESFNPGWSWFKGDAVLNLFLELTNDIHIAYSGSWVSRGKDTTWAGDWEIYGEKGTLVWKDEKIWFLGGGEKREITPLPLEREDQSFSLYEFYRAITENREPETGVKDNMKSLAMVFKSLESVKNRRPVAF